MSNKSSDGFNALNVQHEVYSMPFMDSRVYLEIQNS